MPFELGTAAIAEMALYSLWKYYIGIDLRINNKIMIDVEALTNDFETFKYNCLYVDINQANQKEYTPYLLNGRLNSKNTYIINFTKLHDLDEIDTQIKPINYEIKTINNPS